MLRNFWWIWMFYVTFLPGLAIAKKSVRSLQKETGLLLLPRKLQAESWYTLTSQQHLLVLKWRRSSAGYIFPGSHWTDFHEVLYLGIFRNSVDKTQVSFKSDENSGCFTWRPTYIYDNISLHSSQNENVSDKRCRENQNTHFISKNVFPKIVLFFT